MESYGILSIVPIVIAVAMAIKTKNVIVSLFSSVFLGALMLNHYNPLISTKVLIKGFFVPQLTDSYNAGVIVLMIFIGGFIELMMTSGGAYAFAQAVGHYIDSKKKVQMAAYFTGIMIFFSDLGTPLIVGPIFAPFFRKLKVSKEKLAFILDSTASPVAVLVPFIGWGVFIIGLLQKEFKSLGLGLSDYESFIKAIPFNAYPILAITMIPMITLFGFDFGLMKKFDNESENKYLKEDKEEGRKSKYYVENAKPIFVWLPILVLLFTLFGMLGIKFLTTKVSGSEFRAALSSGYLYAAIVLMILMLINKTKKFKDIFKIYLNGMCKMTEIAIILILAWTLGTINKHLGSADYIVGFIKDINLNSGYIPIITFILGCIVSFSTGSSWGTFSILIPIVIPMSVATGAPLYATIGAVLSGGLFGDHVSPISDTTILASAGAGCEHIDHVKTQMNYAIVNAIIAIIFFGINGFFPMETSILMAIGVQFIIILLIKIKTKN
ncbi:Na+/H+ antiporter NhaC family protein [Fusobacterium sp. MFO224]|uniref:Na+/H+ antiporter NhaC family protein n=1 Tax=Fusobacterium sp. MFO224 TaxID=3378070 RepID=UPI003851B29B